VSRVFSVVRPIFHSPVSLPLKIYPPPSSMTCWNSRWHNLITLTDTPQTHWDLAVQCALGLLRIWLQLYCFLHMEEVHHGEVVCVTEWYILFQYYSHKKINSTSSSISMFYNMQVKGFIYGYLYTSNFHYKQKF